MSKTKTPKKVAVKVADPIAIIPTKPVGLIVAKYKEDVAWCEPLKNAFDVVIYDKSGDKANNALDNVGREAHTYLHHIINNYNNLHERLVFSQANPFDHQPLFVELLPNVHNHDYYDFEVLTTDMNVFPDKIQRYGVTIFEQVQADWLYALLDKMKVKQRVKGRHDLKVAHYGIFAVTRENIRKYPLEFYQELYDYTINHDDGAWLLEILWRTLYHGNGS